MRTGVDELERGVGLPKTNASGAPSGLLVHSYFKREVHSVAWAQLCWGDQPKLPKPANAAAKRGARYEKKVLSLLERSFGNRVLPGPLFCFDKGRAIPDALLFSEDWKACCVVEVKFRHTGDAWHQLNRFYLPVVRRALPAFRICKLELVAGYDPYQSLPQPVAFLSNAEEAFATREAFHPVLVLTERELRNDRGLG